MISAMQIACDESGSEGENLTDSTSQVLSHASVNVQPDEAASLVKAIRALTTSTGDELKSRLFLGKAKTDRAVWFLEQLEGKGAVNITDKRYFVSAKIIALLVEPVMRARGEWLYEDGRAHRIAELLYRSGSGLGSSVLDGLLNAFNILVRIDRSEIAVGRSDRFFEKVREARAATSPGSLRSVLGLIATGEEYGREIENDHSPVFARFLDMDPLLSSVAATAKYWSLRTEGPMELIHDETSALTPERVELIVNGLNEPHPAIAALSAPIRLRSITLVKSHFDDRVQLADILAGIVNSVAIAALRGEDHPLEGRIGRFIDPESMWCDQVSWDRIYT